MSANLKGIEQKDINNVDVRTMRKEKKKVAQNSTLAGCSVQRRGQNELDGRCCQTYPINGTG